RAALAVLHCHPSIISTPPPPPAIYPLSLHDALPISRRAHARRVARGHSDRGAVPRGRDADRRGRPARRRRRRLHATEGLLTTTSDRKSTRLNSSHLVISYAVFCLKKKNGRAAAAIHD